MIEWFVLGTAQIVKAAILALVSLAMATADGAKHFGDSQTALECDVVEGTVWSASQGDVYVLRLERSADGRVYFLRQLAPSSRALPAMIEGRSI